MSRALVKYVRVSPTKARLIAQEVQGMNAELALASLEFMPNKAAGIISKAIASAVANGSYEPQEVEITSCRVDKAAVIKRWRARARGTASRILKPTSHILVEVAPAAAEAVAPAKKTAEVKAPVKKAETKSAPKAEAKAPVKKAPAKKAASDETAEPKAKTKKAEPKAKADGKDA